MAAKESPHHEMLPPASATRRTRAASGLRPATPLLLLRLPWSHAVALHLCAPVKLDILVRGLALCGLQLFALRELPLPWIARCRCRWAARGSANAC